MMQYLTLKVVMPDGSEGAINVTLPHSDSSADDMMLAQLQMLAAINQNLATIASRLGSLSELKESREALEHIAFEKRLA